MSFDLWNVFGIISRQRNSRSGPVNCHDVKFVDIGCTAGWYNGIMAALVATSDDTVEKRQLSWCKLCRHWWHRGLSQRKHPVLKKWHCENSRFQWYAIGTGTWSRYASLGLNELINCSGRACVFIKRVSTMYISSCWTSAFTRLNSPST